MDTQQIKAELTMFQKFGRLISGIIFRKEIRESAEIDKTPHGRVIREALRSAGLDEVIVCRGDLDSYFSWWPEGICKDIHSGEKHRAEIGHFYDLHGVRFNVFVERYKTVYVSNLGQPYYAPWYVDALFERYGPGLVQDGFWLKDGSIVDSI